MDSKDAVIIRLQRKVDDLAFEVKYLRARVLRESEDYYLDELIKSKQKKFEKNKK